MGLGAAVLPEILLGLPIETGAADSWAERQRATHGTRVFLRSFDDVEVLDLLIENSQECVTSGHPPSLRPLR